MNTVLGTMFKLLAVAWRPPTAGPWIEAVVSGMANTLLWCMQRSSVNRISTLMGRSLP